MTHSRDGLVYLSTNVSSTCSPAMRLQLPETKEWRQGRQWLLGERNISNRMLEHLPGKTVDQTQSKRARPTYKRMREDRFRTLDTRPVPPPEVQGGRPSSESSEEEAAPQKEESILPPTPELPREVVQAPTYSPQPSTSAEPQLWLPEVPLVGEESASCSAGSSNSIEHGSSPPLDNTLSEWTNGIIETALSRKLPEKAIPEESIAVIQLLRDALNELINNNNEVPQNRVDEIYENVISLLNVPNDENPRRNGRRKDKQGGRRTRRRYVFARTQDLFKNCPGRLAQMVRDDVSVDEATDEGGQQLNEIDVVELYTKLWGTKPAVQLPHLGDPEPPIIEAEILPLISAEEIRKRISQTKYKSAAGPDGIQKRHINHWPVTEILYLLFNYILCCVKQPSQWRKNRTRLLLKYGKDAKRADSYRPLTIASLLSRPRQNGFVSEAGCFNNVHILYELLRHSKGNNLRHDDTVIGDCLRKKGLPELVVRLVEDCYENVHTVIMRLQRGVKQGDPLSPLLLNGVLEPLLLQLESLPGYGIGEFANVSSLAFA
ncbi:hypothetical protein GEV33_004195 [Tenebrio molitor]|uniref:Reverse transcriptase n=1 Tax=Tenebrio molitor TaxID=7067 RepID=A0A8J6HNL6_TENMO|nr:hypothetical protein GEV33_004195 [Tenebrio molitor]